MIRWATTGIDCLHCPKGNDTIRKLEGCRKLDPAAVSNIPHVVLDGTDLVTSFDYCPGWDVSSPGIHHIRQLVDSAAAGYTLGDVSEAIAAEHDLVLELQAANRAALSMVR